MIGHLTTLGPASYRDQTLLSSSSTIICKEKNKTKSSTSISLFAAVLCIIVYNLRGAACSSIPVQQLVPNRYFIS